MVRVGQDGSLFIKNRQHLIYSVSAKYIYIYSLTTAVSKET